MMAVIYNFGLPENSARLKYFKYPTIDDGDDQDVSIDVKQSTIEIHSRRRFKNTTYVCWYTNLTFCTNFLTMDYINVLTVVVLPAGHL